MKMEERAYQEECIALIDNTEKGSYMVQVATGLGKTYIFSRIKRRGRMLILSHREELVTQPEKFFENCTFGYELRGKTSHGEEVVSASTLSLTKNERYKKFNRNEFDIIVVDEAHHSAAKTYRDLLSYFKPRLLLGFTATPNRGDGVRLDDIYSKIIFKRDMIWGIENGYLSQVECIRINAEYDLSGVKTYMGDYKQSDLDRAMKNSDGKIIEAYQKYAKGATLIFTVSVEQAERLSEKIPNSVAVSAATPERDKIIENFCNRKIDCIINCMIFTEGTDIPLCETIIIARPTKSMTLYTQMVGRGLRKHKDKEYLRLIDCVGNSDSFKICTASSLLGIDINSLTQHQKEQIQGNLLDLPKKVLELSDCPASWIKSVEHVSIWASENQYNLRGINWHQRPDGALTLHIPKNKFSKRMFDMSFVIPAPNELGITQIGDHQIKMQEAIDLVHEILSTRCSDSEKLWSTEIATSTWGQGLATRKQIEYIHSLMGRVEKATTLDGINEEHLTKFEASLIIDRLLELGSANKQKNKWVNCELIRELHAKSSQNQGTTPESDNNLKNHRSISSYLIWRYPKLSKYKDIKNQIDLIYGGIESQLTDDMVYNNIIRSEGQRIRRYNLSGQNPFLANSPSATAYILCEIAEIMFENYTKKGYKQHGAEIIYDKLQQIKKEITDVNTELYIKASERHLTQLIRYNQANN